MRDAFRAALEAARGSRVACSDGGCVAPVGRRSVEVLGGLFLQSNRAAHLCLELVIIFLLFWYVLRETDETTHHRGGPLHKDTPDYQTGHKFSRLFNWCRFSSG